MAAHVIEVAEIKRLVGERAADSHKGSNGRCLVLGGCDGFFGAAAMCAAAALRCGAGTTKAYAPQGARAVFSSLPEVMLHTFPGGTWSTCDIETLDQLLDACDCYAIGPGMGKADKLREVLAAVLKSRKPTVIDADALNMLASSGCFDILHDKCVLTPHIGEMSRLTGLSVDDIRVRSLEAAQDFAKNCGCTVLLKSSVSYITDSDGRSAKNITGNAGLAKGGSGDVLSGIILAMLGQKLAPFDAACVGSYLLGASANDAFSVLKERMLIARDIISVVKTTINGFENKATEE